MSASVCCKTVEVFMDNLVSVPESLINQLNADARGMEYLEGTSNVQKMIIGRELSKI